MVEKVYITYNEVHKLCQSSAERILNDFKPQLMIAIGGGGYVPARILRSFLKRPGTPNIPIQAIGLSLYEQLPSSHSKASTDAHASTNGIDPIEQPGTKVTRTQWLDLSSLEMANLIGKDVLIVDEVDDTRTTLEYAVRELMKDVEEARKRLGRTGDEGRTRFSIFVLHNKDKSKRGNLPDELMEHHRYLAAITTSDVWICYPWEATDIDEHDKLALSQEHGAG
ncbi:MAG: hypoxanthine-guanine phosphoribosyltransferase [Chrysothrix sp. TS-e1954]|nr:MAG: hypoxanthine-guanine phosphoribosyltransferase [Chrysothrix sp. TS-e1954]